ncbi:MAG: TIGR00730 family Rossman fold protein [Pseudomonadota bacterium]|nr:TIGR00730 family Rossman fold protein [Pseudomonadota bacterium]
MKKSIELAKKNRISRGIIFALKFITEFLRGYLTFRNIGPTITVYGSARFKPGEKYYDMALAVGKKLALNGIAVMTGGGPGVMEAANKGAKLVGGKSYGCSVVIPCEQRSNKYVDKSVVFKYFFTRKFMLARFSSAFIALPGGYGTMDEIFEMATLVKTEKISEFPIVLIGSEYWQPLLDYLKNTFVKNGTIYAEELECFYLTDSIDSALEYIETAVKRINNEQQS